ncbi:hypothetical protein ACHAQJ_004822 [Trichoderma viride]
MSTQCIDTPGEKSEFPESSQIDTTNLVIETPNPPPLPLPQRRECHDSEGEDHSATDGASDRYEGLGEDIPSKKSHVATNENRRVLRSRTAKEESINSGSPTSNRIMTPELGKRDREDYENETMRPAKRGRKPAANTEITKFEKDVHGLLEKYASKVHDLETIRTKNQELQIQVDSFKKRLKQVQRDHRQREMSQSRQITSLETDCFEWKRKLVIALDEAKQDSGKYSKVPDSDITEEWRKLSFNIRDLVSQCLTEEPTNECDKLETLMNGLKRYLPLSLCDVAGLRFAVLRRVIWNILILGVFSGRRPIWHGEAGQMLTKFLSIRTHHHVKDPHYLRIISQMKYRAVADLNEETQLNEEAMNRSIGVATAQLYEFIPAWMRSIFRVKMKKLIMDAMGLHTTMMKSKAIFLLEWIGDDDGMSLLPYDPKAMESIQNDVNDTPHYVVEFVEAPALVKYGNADGEDFEFSMILCKASVILGEKKAISTLKVETGPRDGARQDKASDELSNAANRPRSLQERKLGSSFDFKMAGSLEDSSPSTESAI